MNNRRVLRDSPHKPEHDASLRRKARPPRSLLMWFLAGIRQEMPETLHASGTWHDEQRRGDPADYRPVGGSQLGTPRTAEPFRQFLEESASLTELSEYEGHKDQRPSFRYPMRAALARVAGRGSDEQPYPFMARVLYRTALRDGDWDGACASLGIIEPVRWIYIRAALQHLWERYEDEPQPRPYREETPEAA